MTTIVSYCIVHSIPGRLRLRVPQLGLDADYPDRLRGVLAQTSCIREARINPPACSLVVVAEAPLNILESQVARLLVQALSAPPIPPEPSTLEEVQAHLTWPLLSLGAAVCASLLGVPPAWLTGGLVLVAAIPVFESTVHALTHERKLNLDVLDALWTIIHTWEGHFTSPALALSLGEVGVLLRDSTARGTERQELSLLEGCYTHVERSGVEVRISFRDVQVGEKVVVYAGDMIPVDGRVLEGNALVDQRKLTGESKLVHCVAGQELYAATLVIKGRLSLVAERTGQDTHAGMVVDLMKKAPAYDTRLADHAETVADLTITPTLVLSGLVLAFTGNVHQALSLLQLDFGTGIRIAAATTILSAMKSAAEAGVHIRSGRALEMLARVNTILFDKTGTLTEAEAKVVDIYPVLESLTPFELLTLAAAAERGMTHPSAVAIVNYAEDFGLDIGLEWDSWDYEVGGGIFAFLKGDEVLLGGGRFLQSRGVDLEPLHQHYPDLRLSGHTLVYIALAGQLAGAIAITNTMRPESSTLIATLRNQGIEPHLLTGDHAQAAQAVAMRVGILPQHTHADAFPEKKVAVIRSLHDQGRTVAYVGDGINDVAALAYADVSIAMGEGSEVAQQTADIVLIHNDLRGLAQAMIIARQAVQVIEQNIGLVAVPNIGIVMAGVFLALDPVLAVAINSGAMLLAELNGLRPLGSTQELQAQITQELPVSAGNTTLAFL